MMRSRDEMAVWLVKLHNINWWYVLSLRNIVYSRYIAVIVVQNMIVLYKRNRNLVDKGH